MILMKNKCCVICNKNQWATMPPNEQQAQSIPTQIFGWSNDRLKAHINYGQYLVHYTSSCQKEPLCWRGFHWYWLQCIHAVVSFWLSCSWQQQQQLTRPSLIWGNFTPHCWDLCQIMGLLLMCLRWTVCLHIIFNFSKLTKPLFSKGKFTRKIAEELIYN